MFKVLDLTKNDLVAIRIDGKITKGDYDKVTPLIEKNVKEYGKTRLYIQIDSIDGIEPSAFREDVKTYIKHFNHLGKVAVVGESFWQKMWSGLASPFVSGKIKYYSHSQIADAQRWVQE